jgi:hypothetical protein
VVDKPEAVTLQRETVGIRPAVVQYDAPRVRLATTNPCIGHSRRADKRDGHGAGIDKIVERRFDRFRNGVEFGDLNHEGSLASIREWMIGSPTGRYKARSSTPPRCGGTAPHPPANAGPLCLWDVV